MKTTDWIMMMFIFSVLIIIVGFGLYIYNPIEQLPLRVKNGVYYGFALTALCYIANVLIVYGAVKKNGWPSKKAWRDAVVGFCRDFKKGFKG